jgi:endonuclease III
MPEFKKLIAKLKKHNGAPAMPPAKGPFELVLWENACYLLPDDRRAAVFEGLKNQVGLNAKAILKANPDVLLTPGHDGRHASKGACFPLAGDCTNHHEPI